MQGSSPEQVASSNSAAVSKDALGHGCIPWHLEDVGITGK